MSQVKVTGNASGTGTLTIAAPNTNSDYTLTLPTNTGTILTSATTTGFPAGSVLQVLQAVKTDVFSTNSTTFVDVTGLSVSITPSSATNKILVLMDVKLGSQTNVSNYVKLVRGSTSIYIGDAAGSRQRATYANADDPSNEWAYQGVGIYLDSPNTTSATTYKVQMLSEVAVNLGTVYLNTQGDDTDDNQHERLASSITVMEIAA